MEENTKYRAVYSLAPLQNIEIEVRMSMKAREWEQFCKHAEKTGNEVVREVASHALKALEKIKQAMEILK